MKTRQEIRLELDKKNAEFAAMDKEGQRVQIAKDVLIQLESKKFKADHMYVYISEEQGSKEIYDKVRCLAEKEPDTNMAEVLETAPECRVCGIGSMFMAAISRDKRRTVKHRVMATRGAIIKYLEPYFSQEELNFIESIFEQTNTHMGEEFNAYDFGMARIDNNDERLRAIMQNIIDNKGNFTPV